MEVEESFDLLFENLNFENTGSILPLARKCISVSPGEREVVRALEVILNVCLKHFTVEELENEVFEPACPVARGMIVEKLEEIEKKPTGCAESLGVSLTIISFFQKVFEYLNEIEKVSIVKVKSFLKATCDVLLKCFSHCKISKKIYDPLFSYFAEHLSNFFKKCCSLQHQLLNFLTQKAECNVEDDREVELIAELMNSISKSGLVLINLEIKAMAEVWKTFIFLIDKYLCCLKNNYNIGETINKLCCIIISSITTVPGNVNKDFNKIIKLNCFLLKLIIKFCEVFVGYLKSCHCQLLNLLLKLYRWDVANVPDQHLMNQLTVGTEPLLSQLMTDEDFVNECYVVSHDSEKSAEFAIFSCSVLKKLLDSNGATRSLWFNSRDNVLQWILLSASSSQFITCANLSLPTILLNGKQKKFTDLYEYVLVSASAFLMTATSDEYQVAEETLVKSILQTNPIRALLAIDIWCILARFADSELCFSQIVTLGKVFQEFHSGTFRVEKWYLMSLIQRLFPLLAESHRVAFLKSFQPPFYSSVWEGSKFDGFTTREACDVCEGMVSQVDELVDRADGDSEKVVSTGRESVINEKFGGKILKLWKFNCQILSSTPDSVRFLKITCALTGCIVSEMPAMDLLMVLTQMKTLLLIGQPTSTKLYFTWILNSLSSVRIPPGELQKQIVLTTADIFKMLLTSKEAFVKQKALETFSSFAHRTSHGEVISMSVQNAPELKVELTEYLKKKPLDQSDLVLSDYVKEISQVKFRHVCPEAVVGDGVTCKKIKLDAPERGETTWTVSWMENGKKILECFHLLSDAEKTEIQKLCCSILSLKAF